MKVQPKEITLCKLDCVLMPQGEVICKGKTVGWFRDLKSELHPDSDDLLDVCKELAVIFPEKSMSAIDAADFKDRAHRIWVAAESAKNIIAKAEV